MKMPPMQVMLPDDIERLHDQAQYLYEFDKSMSWWDTLEMWKAAFTEYELTVLKNTLDVAVHPYDDEVFDTWYHMQSPLPRPKD